MALIKYWAVLRAPRDKRLAPMRAVACQRDGTASLPRVWDHLDVSVSIAGLAFGVKAGALVESVSLPVGGSFDDQGVCS